MVEGTAFRGDDPAITQLAQAEAALRESEENIHVVLRLAPV